MVCGDAQQLIDLPESNRSLGRNAPKVRALVAFLGDFVFALS